MIISVSGIKRSASTVQFNLIRIALEMAGYTVNIRGHSYTPREVPEGQVDLVKRHKFSKEIAEKADHIFLTDRKDEEIIESLTQFNGKPPYEGRIEDMRKHLERWKEHSFHSVYPYEVWQKSPTTYTAAIISTLELGVTYNDVLEAFNEIEPPESGQDKTTLLFSNHITSENHG